MIKYPADRACAVNEETGDGTPVGRCWFYVGPNDVCPRHGNVASVMQTYRASGRLTRERELDRASTGEAK